MQLFLEKNATVTVCHSQTKDLAYFTRQADILVSAVGKTNLIKKDMVKEGSVVVDVGINRIPSETEKGYILVGDIDFENVKEKCSAITPVPGGIGVMTIACLLENTVFAAKNFS